MEATGLGKSGEWGGGALCVQGYLLRLQSAACWVVKKELSQTQGLAEGGCCFADTTGVTTQILSIYCSKTLRQLAQPPEVFQQPAFRYHLCRALKAELLAGNIPGCYLAALLPLHQICLLQVCLVQMNLNNLMSWCCCKHLVLVVTLHFLHGESCDALFQHSSTTVCKPFQCCFQSNLRCKTQSNKMGSVLALLF